MYQSLVALEDCPEEVGGFYNTPGCIPFLKTWVSERRIPHRKWVSHRIPVDDPMVKYLQKVPLRKGTERGKESKKKKSNTQSNCRGDGDIQHGSDALQLPQHLQQM